MQPEPKMLQSMPFPVSVYVPDTKLREAVEKQTNKQKTQALVICPKEGNTLGAVQGL